MSIVSMYLTMKERFFRRTVVRYLDVDGHLIDSLVLLYFERLCSSFVSFEIARLVHIKPDS